MAVSFDARTDMLVRGFPKGVDVRDRSLASLGSLVIAVAAVSLSPAAVTGQTPAPPAKVATKTWTPPLTRDGHPDLQGVWLSNSATPLERPKGLEGKPFLTDAEVTELQKRADRLFKEGRSDYAGGDSAFLAALANLEVYKNPAGTTCDSLLMIEREFDNRTSLILDPPDGRLPPLTSDARQRQAKRAEARQRSPADGPEDRNAIERCITPGVPRLGGNFGAGPYSYYQIVQTAGYVVLYMETFHDARIIPLDRHPHLPESIRLWNGDPRGRWEGNTLVVDTTNFSPQSNFMGSAEGLHLVERFTRVAPDTINYEITLNDPTTWTNAWTAVVRLKQTQDSLYEFACHEGNHAMRGILAGARAEEKAVEQAAKGPK